MSTKTTIVLLLLAAAAVGIFVFLRRRAVQTGSGVLGAAVPTTTYIAPMAKAPAPAPASSRSSQDASVWGTLKNTAAGIIGSSLQQGATQLGSKLGISLKF